MQEDAGVGWPGTGGQGDPSGRMGGFPDGEGGSFPVNGIPRVIGSSLRYSEHYPAPDCESGLSPGSISCKFAPFSYTTFRESLHCPFFGNPGGLRGA